MSLSSRWEFNVLKFKAEHLGYCGQTARSEEGLREHQSGGSLGSQPAWVPLACGIWPALQLSGHASCRGTSDLQGVPLLKGALWSGVPIILSPVAKHPAQPETCSTSDTGKIPLPDTL